MARKKKNIEPQILFPPNIHQLALDFCRERLKTEAVEQARKADKAKEMKQQRRFRLQHGLEDAKRIFVWATAFRKSDIGQELIKKSGGRIFFFDGHVEGVEWIGLENGRQSLYWTWKGKGTHSEEVNSAVDLALAVDPRVLREACEWIDNELVWDCIVQRLGFLKKD